MRAQWWTRIRFAATAPHQHKNMQAYANEDDGLAVISEGKSETPPRTLRECSIIRKRRDLYVVLGEEQQMLCCCGRKGARG